MIRPHFHSKIARDLILNKTEPKNEVSYARFPDGELFHCENLGLLKQWVDTQGPSFQLIYLDPPFGTGRVFRFSNGSIAFSDTLQGEAYLNSIWPQLVFCHQLLRDDGALFVHLEPKIAPYVKILLDELFGFKPSHRTIVWKRSFAHSGSKTLANTHDVIFFYSKTGQVRFNSVQRKSGTTMEKRFPLCDGQGRRFSAGDLTGESLKTAGNPSYSYSWNGHHRIWRCPKSTMEKYQREGRIYYTRNGLPRKKRYLEEAKMMVPTDVWDDIPPLHSQSRERTGYPTQKPETLLHRIIASCTQPGDLILDPCCGSGTALAVARKLNRRWIGIDREGTAINISHVRLKKVHNPVGITN